MVQSHENLRSDYCRDSHLVVVKIHIVTVVEFYIKTVVENQIEIVAEIHIEIVAEIHIEIIAQVHIEIVVDNHIQINVEIHIEIIGEIFVKMTMDWSTTCTRETSMRLACLQALQATMSGTKDTEESYRRGKHTYTGPPIGFNLGEHGSDGVNHGSKVGDSDAFSETATSYENDELSVIDRLILSQGFVDYMVEIAPSDIDSYHHDPESNDIESLSPASPPLKYQFIESVAKKLLYKQDIHISKEGRMFKVLSSKKEKPPWRAQIRLHKTDDCNAIVKELANMEVRYKKKQSPTVTLNFAMNARLTKSSNMRDDYVSYKVTWGNFQHLTNACEKELIKDFDSRIPDGYPKILQQDDSDPNIINLTEHWTIIRADLPSYDPSSNLSVKQNDNALIFMISKATLIEMTGHVIRMAAAPAYVFASLIEGSQAIQCKLDVDIMAYKYCTGTRTTHDERLENISDHEFSPKEECPTCLRDIVTMGNKFKWIRINRCRACFIDMGKRSHDPNAYDKFRLEHDCVVEERQKVNLMKDYKRPPLPVLHLGNPPRPDMPPPPNPEVGRVLEQREEARKLAKQKKLEQDEIIKKIIEQRKASSTETPPDNSHEPMPQSEPRRSPMATPKAKKLKRFA